MRLRDEEADIIEFFRQTGALPDQNVIQSDSSVLNLHNKSLEIKSRYKGAITELDQTREMLSFALMINEKIEKSKNYRHRFTKKKRFDSESVAFGVLGDWHVDERIEPETLNGKNEYNPEIADKRISNIFPNLLYLVDKERTATEIRTLVLSLLGDFISGYIHPELIENNTMSPLEAIMFVFERVRCGIDFLLENGEFEQIIVCCAYGNHARLSAKPKISTGYKNNLEWMMYHLLANCYIHEDRIDFIIPNGNFGYIDLYDKYRIRVHHGDLINYSNSFAGANANVQKAILQWEQYEDTKIFLDVFGHHHGRYDGGNYVISGTLAGYNCYARSIKAKYESPSQEFFLVERDHGKTTVAPIFVE